MHARPPITVLQYQPPTYQPLPYEEGYGAGSGGGSYYERYRSQQRQ
jgi:hypothetical protein